MAARNPKERGREGEMLVCKEFVKLAQKRSRHTDVPQLMKEKTYAVRSRSPEGGDVVAPSAFTRTPRGGQKISLYQTIYVLGSVWGC